MFQDRHLPFNPETDAPELKIVSQEEKDEWVAEGEADKPVLPLWKKILNWFCGTESMQDTREPVYTQEEADEIVEEAARMVNIEQNKIQAILTDVAMAIVCGLTVFIWGFFA